MDGTHNIAKIEAYSCWAKSVVSIKKTFMSIYEVQQAKETFSNVKYSNIEEYLQEVFLLDLTIEWRGTDRRDEVLRQVQP